MSVKVSNTLKRIFADHNTYLQPSSAIPQYQLVDKLFYFLKKFT